MSREAEIEAGLARVRARIDRACADAGRSPGEVSLVVVTCALDLVPSAKVS